MHVVLCGSYVTEDTVLLVVIFRTESSFLSLVSVLLIVLFPIESSFLSLVLVLLVVLFHTGTVSFRCSSALKKKKEKKGIASLSLSICYASY